MIMTMASPKVKPRKTGFANEIGDVPHAGQGGNNENQAGHGDKARGKHQSVTGIVPAQRQGRCSQDDS